MKGFQTALGDIYTLTETGQTVLEKRSPGKGQGRICPPHNCLYVETPVTNVLGIPYIPEVGFRIGYADPDGENFTSCGYGPLEVPEGKRPAVYAFYRPSEIRIGLFFAELEPRIGLHPVQKAYCFNGTSSNHVGEAIIHLHE